MARPFDLGDWRVDPERGLLTSAAGGEVRLEPRQMELLQLFAGSSGRVLAKDEIVAAVWGGRVVGDDTLAAAVSRLRAALGGGRRSYIETLPKRGYRLVLDRGEGREARAAPPASEASALVREAWALLGAPLAPNIAQARVRLERAIALDATCAPAHAALAQALLVQQFVGAAPGAGLAALACAAAQAAVALDPGLAEGWTALGSATFLATRDTQAADTSLRRAVARDPDAAAPRRARAWLLAAAGNFAEAEREARAGIERDPSSVAGRATLLQVLLLARRWRATLVEARRVLDLAPQAAEAWSAKAWAHVFLGEPREALEALKASLRAWTVDERRLDTLAVRFEADGIEGLCGAVADLLEGQAVMYRARPLDIALLRAWAGDADAAFAALERALAHDDPYLVALAWMPHLDRLRNDPRLAGVIERARPAR